MMIVTITVVEPNDKNDPQKTNDPPPSRDMTCWDLSLICDGSGDINKTDNDNGTACYHTCYVPKKKKKKSSDRGRPRQYVIKVYVRS